MNITPWNHKVLTQNSPGVFILMKLLRIAIIFNLCLLIIGFAHISHAFELLVSASDTNPAKGSQVNFTCEPSGGTPPYTYCWDFGTPPNNAKLGEWSHENEAICYSNGQNPSHTFNEFGEYKVWVYVKDSSATPVSQKAVLIVNVNVGGIVVDATAPLPTGPGLIGDGLTDNTDKLARWASNSGNQYITVKFPAGVYRFSATNRFSSGSGLKAIQLSAEVSNPVKLLFNPANSSDDVPDTFLSTDGVTGIYAKGITLESDLHGGSPDQWDMTLGFKNGHGVFQYCTIQNFSGPFVDGSPYIVMDCNILDWGPGLVEAFYPGGTHTYRHQLFEGPQNNCFMARNYAKTKYKHEHHIYSPRGKEFIYFLKNFLDGTNHIVSQYMIHLYGGTGKHSNKFFYNNYVYNSKNSPIYIAGDVSNIEFYDNLFIKVDSGLSSLLRIENNTENFDFSYNHIQENGLNSALVAVVGIGISNVKFTNNNFGKSAPMSPYKIWSFESDDLLPCYGVSEEENPSCNNISIASNVNSSIDRTILDPEPREFDSPKNCSINIVSQDSNTVNVDLYANDYDSGMFINPRWPFTEGGLVQFSHDGVHWSEVMPYATQATWMLPAGANKESVLVRFRDRDGNWTTPIGLNGSVDFPKPPKGLRIIAKN